MAVDTRLSASTWATLFRRQHDGLLVIVQGTLLLLLLLSLSVPTVNAQNAPTLTIRNSCTPGQQDCGWFGCAASGLCPQECSNYGNIDACNGVQLNGRGCVWWGGQCIPDAQCKMENDQCTAACRRCAGYGCVPAGSRCPLGCESFGNPDRCNRQIVSNGMTCTWSATAGVCNYSVNRTPLNELSQLPSALGGTASLAPSPSSMLRGLAQRTPGLLPISPDGIIVTGADVLSKMPASPGNNGRGNNPATTTTTTSPPTNGIQSTTGNDNGGSGTGPGNGAPAGSGSGPNPGDTQAGADNNVDTRKSIADGSTKMWGAMIGVVVSLVAIAGIAFLVIQQRLRARREMQVEQRNAAEFNVQPDHRRESLLPFVQNALNANNTNTVPTPPPPASMR